MPETSLSRQMFALVLTDKCTTTTREDIKTYMMRHELALIKKTMQNTHTKNKPKPPVRTAHMSVCITNCAQLQNTTVHRTVLTVFPHILQSSQLKTLSIEGDKANKLPQSVLQAFIRNGNSLFPFSHGNPAGVWNRNGNCYMGMGGNGKQKCILADLSTLHRVVWT